MPAISDIKISIENKHFFVKDEFVKKGEFVRNSNGSLQMFAGGFTAVFPVVVNGEKWAFRCWHSNLGNVKRRFGKISDSIKSANVSYLCDFKYVDEGIIVNGKIYPTTRMRWIDGLTIKDYICKYATDKSKMQSLAANFLAIVRDMHKHHFAHGDLQHGNLIVDNTGSIFLVDYDSFFCPELVGERDIITGLIDYQHPARKNNAFTGEKLDYFSELVIYTSILAISANPSLIKKYHVADSERMLFSANDYLDFVNSGIYKDLQALTPEIQQLLSTFLIYLSKSSIEELMPFDSVPFPQKPAPRPIPKPSPKKAPIPVPKPSPKPAPKPIPKPVPPKPQNEECYCIYCGKKLMTSYRFCTGCGKPNYSFKP